MAPEINEIHHVIETTVNTLSIVLNCYLLYLIRYYSTFGVKLYQFLLTVDVLLDLFLGSAAFLAQPVAIPGDGNLVIISNGFYAGRSAAIDSMLLTFYLFVLHTNIVWIPVQFVYRYRLLCKQNKNLIRTNVLIINYAVVYSMIALAVIHYGVCLVRLEFQEIGRQVLDLNGWPQEKNNSQDFIMGRDIKEWEMIIYVALWSMTCYSSIGIVIWCEKAIAKHFNRLGDLSHGPAQRMHREFQRALLAMAICPLVTTTIPVLYFMVIIGLKPGLISAIMTIMASSITLFNPMTTIICFRCYRQATIRLLTCGRYKCIAKVQNTSSAANINAVKRT